MPAAKPRGQAKLPGPTLAAGICAAKKHSTERSGINWTSCPKAFPDPGYLFNTVTDLL